MRMWLTQAQQNPPDGPDAKASFEVASSSLTRVRALDGASFYSEVCE
jgi:hypothetical protein